jgi:hypothetical protein
VGSNDAIPGRKKDCHSQKQMIEDKMHQSNSLVNSWYCQWIYLDEKQKYRDAMDGYCFGSAETQKE